MRRAVSALTSYDRIVRIVLRYLNIGIATLWATASDRLFYSVQRSLLMRFQVHDEAMLAFWAETRRECERLAAPYSFSDGALERLRHVFCRILMDNPADVFECVAVTAVGASKSVIRLCILGAFKRSFAEAAQGFIVGSAERHFLVGSFHVDHLR